MEPSLVKKVGREVRRAIRGQGVTGINAKVITDRNRAERVYLIEITDPFTDDAFIRVLRALNTVFGTISQAGHRFAVWDGPHDRALRYANARLHPAFGEMTAVVTVEVCEGI